MAVAANIHRRGGAALALLVLLLSILAATFIAPLWDGKETITYNIMLTLVLPFLFPGSSSIMDEPLDVQVSHWAKTTKAMEYQANADVAKMTGSAYFEASYGATPTRTIHFSVPSSSATEEDDDSHHDIPVMCACPHAATPKEKLPVVFYFFGGGFILGSIGAEMMTERWLAQESDSVVCAIGYRLAPEFPYPAGVNDAVDAAVAILEQRTKVDVEKLLGTGIDVDRIGTWGTSAGGYMAAQTSRRLAERGYGSLRCQVSQVPMVRPFGGTSSLLKNWNDIWSGLHNIYAWTVYLKGDDGTLVADWRVNLLIDPPPDVVKRLPPTYVVIHSRDVLRDEGEMYAKRLESMGKLIEVKEYDVSHVGALPFMAKGGTAEGMDVKAASTLREYLHK